MTSSKWIAVPTFYKNNTICFSDLNSHLKYIEPYYDNVIIMGSTGDQAYLTLNEKKSIIDYVCSKEYDFNIIFGVTSTRYSDVIALVNYINTKKFNDIMLLNILYFKFNQEELFNYVKDISTISNGEILLYNNPQRSNNKFEVSTINKLLKQKCIKFVKDVSDNNPSDIETLHVFSGFDIELLNNNYFSTTSVIGNIMPGYVSNIIEGKASSTNHQQFIYLISELNKIGLVKSIKYLLYLNQVINYYEMPKGFLKLTPKEEQTLNDLNTLIKSLNSQYVD